MKGLWEVRAMSGHGGPVAADGNAASGAHEDGVGLPGAVPSSTRRRQQPRRCRATALLVLFVAAASLLAALRAVVRLLAAAVPGCRCLPCLFRRRASCRARWPPAFACGLVWALKGHMGCDPLSSELPRTRRTVQAPGALRCYSMLLEPLCQAQAVLVHAGTEDKS